jgi:hypothetical protein
MQNEHCLLAQKLFVDRYRIVASAAQLPGHQRDGGIFEPSENE